MKNQTKLTNVILQVYENVSVEITINNERTGYTFKTPKAFGGRFYYSFSNDVEQALEEQYPELEYELRMNIRNK